MKDVLRETVRLADAGEPHALATVVSVVPPASAKRGDRGLVTADGALVGWVGGACSEPIVVREALRALGEGTPRLVRIGPPGTTAGAGVVCAESHCASEGVVDVLIEPQLPAPLLSIAGDGPCARTLAELARTIGWRVTDELDSSADACVVATMGRDDVETVAGALAGTADYVALVASSRRAGAVFELLREDGVPEEAVARVRSPAGLDLGPCTQEEIAVAVLAELVAWRHSRTAGAVEAPPAEAVDPVCGMTVSVGPSTIRAEHDGRTWYFCCPHCRATFLKDLTVP